MTKTLSIGFVLLVAACSNKKADESPPAPPPAPAPASTPAAPAAKPAAPAPAGDPLLGEHLLAVGAHAPAFSMTAHDGTTVALPDNDGPMVVYFYPKDATPG